MTPLTHDEFRVRWADPLRFDHYEAEAATRTVRDFAVVGLDRKPGKRNAVLYRLGTGRMCAVWWTRARVIVVEFYEETRP